MTPAHTFREGQEGRQAGRGRPFFGHGTASAVCTVLDTKGGRAI